jgi:hypothetical protein
VGYGSTSAKLACSIASIAAASGTMELPAMKGATSCVPSAPMQSSVKTSSADARPSCSAGSVSASPKAAGPRTASAPQKPAQNTPTAAKGSELIDAPISSAAHRPSCSQAPR